MPYPAVCGPIPLFNIAQFPKEISDAACVSNHDSAGNQLTGIPDAQGECISVNLPRDGAIKNRESSRKQTSSDDPYGQILYKSEPEGSDQHQSGAPVVK
jgi:hypothetical protein